VSKQGRPVRSSSTFDDGGPLLVSHRSGDTEAFTELVQLYRVRIYTYLVRSGVRDGERDDLFQEIFFTVHRYAGRYDPTLPLAPWLFTIAVNAVRSHFRSPRNKREILQDEVPDAVDEAPTAGEVLEGRELAKWLERELMELPEDQRDAMLLCYIKDMEQEDAAKALGMNTNTLKTNLRRARITLVERITKLRKSELLKEGGEE
jgi:RNA polymerase sigma-70 factor (ECF subfamily)